MTKKRVGFNCADEKYVAISATTEQFWQPFCKAIDAPGLASDARFTTSELRIQNHWSMKPLWPLQKWGWGASAAIGP